MEGIEILNQVECLQYSTGAIYFLIGLGILWFVTFILSAFIDECKIPTYLITGLFMISIILVSAFGKTEPSGRYQYEVTIDDSASFTELYEKYDVVKQKGKIWILEDKEE